jgi:hypothetical protein
MRVIMSNLKKTQKIDIREEDSFWLKDRDGEVSLLNVEREDPDGEDWEISHLRELVKLKSESFTQ